MTTGPRPGWFPVILLMPITRWLAGWRREHSDLHRGMTIKDALGAKFTVPFVEVRRPYLARMLGRADLEAAEHALIDAQVLPALGFWLIAEKAD